MNDNPVKPLASGEIFIIVKLIEISRSTSLHYQLPGCGVLGQRRYLCAFSYILIRYSVSHFSSLQPLANRLNCKHSFLSQPPQACQSTMSCLPTCVLASSMLLPSGIEFSVAMSYACCVLPGFRLWPGNAERSQRSRKVLKEMDYFSISTGSAEYLRG